MIYFLTSYRQLLLKLGISMHVPFLSLVHLCQRQWPITNQATSNKVRGLDCPFQVGNLSNQGNVLTLQGQEIF